MASSGPSGPGRRRHRAVPTTPQSRPSPAGSRRRPTGMRLARPLQRKRRWSFWRSPHTGTTRRTTTWCWRRASRTTPSPSPTPTTAWPAVGGPPGALRRRRAAGRPAFRGSRTCRPSSPTGAWTQPHRQLCSSWLRTCRPRCSQTLHRRQARGTSTGYSTASSGRSRPPSRARLHRAAGLLTRGPRQANRASVAAGGRTATPTRHPWPRRPTPIPGRRAAAHMGPMCLPRPTPRPLRSRRRPWTPSPRPPGCRPSSTTGAWMQAPLPHWWS
mmetsp:Transcript_94127/g.280905  ORF Transcript_94127/g.280905 Transcript_94127/m.280905 type:complete len:271 (+) Transcript_94127:500-1312(+)